MPRIACYQREVLECLVLQFKKVDVSMTNSFYRVVEWSFTMKQSFYWLVRLNVSNFIVYGANTCDMIIKCINIQGSTCIKNNVSSHIMNKITRQIAFQTFILYYLVSQMTRFFFFLQQTHI